MLLAVGRFRRLLDLVTGGGVGDGGVLVGARVVK
jgi:hypothetical protein